MLKKWASCPSGTRDRGAACPYGTFDDIFGSGGCRQRKSEGQAAPAQEASGSDRLMLNLKSMLRQLRRTAVGRGDARVARAARNGGAKVARRARAPPPCPPVEGGRATLMAPAVAGGYRAGSATLTGHSGSRSSDHVTDHILPEAAKSRRIGLCSCRWSVHSGFSGRGSVYGT